MKRHSYALAVLGLFMATVAWGQSITISGPEQIKVEKGYWYDVTGLSMQQMRTAKIDVQPGDGVILRPLMTWTGDALIYLEVTKDCDGCVLDLRISLNAWRQTLKRSIQEAEEGGVDEAIVLDLRLIDAEASADYPTASGGISIQVGKADDDEDEDEDDDEDDDDNDFDPDQKWSIIIFRESGNQDLSLEQLEIVNSLLFREKLEDLGHEMREFDPDAASNLPSEFIGYWQAVKDKPLPQVAVAPINGGEVWTFPLPESTGTFLNRLRGGPN